MTGDPRAGLPPRVGGLAERLGDVLVLVVEAGVDFTQPARFRPAFCKVRPGVELLTRRSAIAAAGELTPAVQGHRLGGKPKFQAMDFARIGLCLCASSARYGERCNDKSNRRPARQVHVAHCFIGSHWRVSVPQNSTQSAYVD